MLTNKVRADYLFGNKVHGLASVTWHPCIYSLSTLQSATILYTWREKQRKRMEKEQKEQKSVWTKTRGRNEDQFKDCESEFGRR